MYDADGRKKRGNCKSGLMCLDFPYSDPGGFLQGISQTPKSYGERLEEESVCIKSAGMQVGLLNLFFRINLVVMNIAINT